VNKLDQWFDSKQFTIAFVAATGDSTSVDKKSQRLATVRPEREGGKVPSTDTNSTEKTT
jgi:hypothetical protein